jgi:phosphatidylglycerophosphatase A
MKRVALGLATVAGAGYFPVAPGTIGSAVGTVLYLWVCQWSLAQQTTLIVAIAVAGTWAAGIAEDHFGRSDPGQVVIDEVLGQLVTLFAIRPSLTVALLGFFLFRALDIVKPWPARQFERLPRGLGIMADDAMAGVYGNLLVRLFQLFVPGL